MGLDESKAQVDLTFSDEIEGRESFYLDFLPRVDSALNTHALAGRSAPFRQVRGRRHALTDGCIAHMRFAREDPVAPVKSVAK